MPSEDDAPTPPPHSAALATESSPLLGESSTERRGRGWGWGKMVGVGVGGGSGEGTIVLNNFHISSLTPTTISIHVNATQHIKEPPPLDIHMSPVSFLLCTLGTQPPPTRRSRPSLFPPRIPVSWEDEDRSLGIPRRTTPPVVLSVPFPGLVTREGKDEVPIVFDAEVGRLDFGFWRGFLRGVVGWSVEAGVPDRGEPPLGVTFRQQGVPVMRIPGIGRWRIPMWTYFRYEPTIELSGARMIGGGGEGEFFGKLNVTVEEQEVGYDAVELPDGTVAQVLSMNVTASFTNPTAITFGPQHVVPASPVAADPPRVQLALSYNGTRILHMKVYVGPAGVFALSPGRNQGGLRMEARADVEGTERLADWIGVYADGGDTVLTVREVEVVGRFGEGSMVPGWVGEFLEGWEVRVLVPGAKEEDEDGGGGGVWGVLLGREMVKLFEKK
ncbi:hypothetical protein HDU67_008019 [Dinochytrium kinnereticum]|nr:hypothetical protein HDU67_008019 [Dinochytrium kinnereticum]